MKADDKEYLLAFGENLKKLIESRKTTPAEVAAHGYLETKQVYRVLNGEHNSTLSILRGIAKGLGVQMKTLFEFDFKEKQ